MSVEFLALIVAIVGSVVGTGGIVALLKVRADVAKTEAETDSIITTAAERAVGVSATAIDQLEDELDSVRAELVEQKKRRYELAERVERLELWIRTNTAVDPEAIT